MNDRQHKTSFTISVLCCILFSPTVKGLLSTTPTSLRVDDLVIRKSWRSRAQQLAIHATNLFSKPPQVSKWDKEIYVCKLSIIRPLFLPFCGNSGFQKRYNLQKKCDEPMPVIFRLDVLNVFLRRIFLRNSPKNL